MFLGPDGINVSMAIKLHVGECIVRSTLARQRASFLILSSISPHPYPTTKSVQVNARMVEVELL